MSWTKLTAVSAPRGDRLTVRITTAGYEKPHVVIRVARSIAAQAGIPTDKKSRVHVYLGDGAQAGRMLITTSRHGEFGCYPSGKAGACKISLSVPPGAPAEYPLRTVKAAIEEDVVGLSFPLPWHVPAGEREVEDLPEYRTWKLPPELSPAAMSAVRAQDYPHGPPPKLGAPDEEAEGVPAFLGSDTVAAMRKGDRLLFDSDGVRVVRTEEPPATLDAIEEAARPTSDDIAKMADAVQDALDKPVNGTARTHVYADTEEAEGKLTFTHDGKSCHLNRRQHIVVSKLYAVMLKNIPGGFIVYDDLIKATGVRDKYILHATVAGARKRITALGLEIKAIERTGYWMEAV